MAKKMALTPELKKENVLKFKNVLLPKTFKVEDEDLGTHEFTIKNLTNLQHLKISESINGIDRKSVAFIITLTENVIKLVSENLISWSIDDEQVDDPVELLKYLDSNIIIRIFNEL